MAISVSTGDWRSGHQPPVGSLEAIPASSGWWLAPAEPRQARDPESGQARRFSAPLTFLLATAPFTRPSGSFQEPVERATSRRRSASSTRLVAIPSSGSGILRGYLLWLSDVCSGNLGTSYTVAAGVKVRLSSVEAAPISLLSAAWGWASPSSSRSEPALRRRCVPGDSGQTLVRGPLFPERGPHLLDRHLAPGDLHAATSPSPISGIRVDDGGSGGSSRDHLRQGPLLGASVLCLALGSTASSSG